MKKLILTTILVVLIFSLVTYGEIYCSGICADWNFSDTADEEDFLVLLDYMDNDGVCVSCLNLYQDPDCDCRLDGRDIAVWSDPSLNMCPRTSSFGVSEIGEISSRYIIEGFAAEIGRLELLRLSFGDLDFNTTAIEDINIISKVPSSRLEVENVFSSAIIDGIFITDYTQTFNGRLLVVGFFSESETISTGWLGEKTDEGFVWQQLPIIPITIQDGLPILLDRWLTGANFVDYARISR